MITLTTRFTYSVTNTVISAFHRPAMLQLIFTDHINNSNDVHEDSRMKLTKAINELIYNLDQHNYTETFFVINYRTSPLPVQCSLYMNKSLRRRQKDICSTMRKTKVLRTRNTDKSTLLMNTIQYHQNTSHKTINNKMLIHRTTGSKRFNFYTALNIFASSYFFSQLEYQAP